ncbi:uncharacterized protein [Littorina saxatilis]|uniref:uncharacterized protein n=1 Tax=Littorina saxatilis TaxID=31220 RepID=UPI0038B561E7
MTEMGADFQAFKTQTNADIQTLQNSMQQTAGAGYPERTELHLRSLGWAALLYGAEYEAPDSHQNKDPVCAVCRSTLSTTVMIPGTKVCTPGWHLQYSGYLMAGSYDLTAGTEYICVHSERESTAYGDADEDADLGTPVLHLE